MKTPSNAVVLLLDSLNRHALSAYGGGEVDTPNLDRLAARGVRFTQHYSGSLPCMPARHDLLCGALDFLWKPWGSIEVWERPVTHYVRRAGVVTMLVTDHPHLFEHGGENYHADFYAWEYLRGHESDPWQTIVDETMAGTPTYHRPADNHYHRNRRMFLEEADFPGPKTMAAAAAWLDDNAGKHDRFLLFVDEFDPHEPFDTPEPYRSMYDKQWTGRPLIWPPYTTAAIDPAEARQLRAQYHGKLTMIDTWLGRVLDSLDRHQLWDDTLIVLVADHGLYLGEHDNWGKPPSPIYNTLGHIPLMMVWPGCEGGTTCDALTTNVDLCATLLDLFGAGEMAHQTNGRSLLPLLRGEADTIRDYVLSGYWGQRVQLIDAESKLMCGVVDPDKLCIHSNRWSTMPPFSLPPPNERATLGPYMPGTDIPVIRQPLTSEERRVLIWTWGDHRDDRLFDLGEDPDETCDLSGDAGRIERAREQLRAALDDVSAPPDLLARHGLG